MKVHKLFQSCLLRDRGRNKSNLNLILISLFQTSSSNRILLQHNQITVAPKIRKYILVMTVTNQLIFITDMDQNNKVIRHDMFTSHITANPSVILQKKLLFGLHIDKLKYS